MPARFSYRPFAIACVCIAGTLIGFSSPSQSQDERSPRPGPPTEARPDRPTDRPMTPTEQMRAEIDSLVQEVSRLRVQLAEARTEADQLRRERDEMRQFIADHDQFGPAFERYRAVVEIAEREARQRELEAARARRDADRLEREARLREARDLREARRADQAEERRLREAGFTHIGMNVYVGQTSFHYGPRDAPAFYDPWHGFHHYTGDTQNLNFASMTISGAVINAAMEVRNIGVAVTFFDARGNQVGHEIIQINNARPNVPYPFTSNVRMALDRPFSSSSTYVLYADVVED